MKLPLRIFVVGLLAGLPTISRAQLVNFNYHLDGLQSHTNAPGTGAGTATLDLQSLLLHVDLSFTGLLAPATAAHIHNGALGVNGPVIIPFVGFPNTTSGTFSFSTVITAVQADLMLANHTYVNVHTSVFPGGEIRGQVISAIPEPGTLGLLATAALAALAGWRAFSRRRMRPGLAQPA
jgi:hypothetical protein